VANLVSLQTLEFFYSALMGVCLGALFDLFRVLRFFSPGKRILTVVTDILFWNVAIIILFAFVLTVSNGRMRWYVLLGTFCGGFVYISAVSEIVFRVCVSVVFLIKKFLWMITHPVYLVLRWMWRGVKQSYRGRMKKIKERRESVAEKREEQEKEKTQFDA